MTQRRNDKTTADDGATRGHEEGMGNTLVQLENASLDMFSSERDEMLPVDMDAVPVIVDKDDFISRDPFSADYVDFAMGRKALKKDGGAAAARRKLRDDLLSRPHLMPKPEEAAHRGSAAVWRSLRDQLKEISLGQIDSSGPEELQLLRNDLMARKQIVDSVAEGLTKLIERLDNRLAAATVDRGDPGAAPSTAAGTDSDPAGG